jgi:hypothetical protein
MSDEGRKRSIDWISRVLSIAAIIISATISVLSIYFSNFYSPENLLVAARVQNREQVGTGHLDLILVFTNRGKRPVAIENVSLALNYGKKARIEEATNWMFEGQIALRDVGSVPGNTTKMQNGTLFNMYDAAHATVNNRETSSSAALVEGNNVTLMSLSFEPGPINIFTEGPIVQSVAIRYFDGDGGERLRIFPLGIMSSPDGKGHLYNPAPPSALSQLLPYKSIPEKRPHRGKTE